MGMNMSRKQMREARTAQAVVELVDEVLENWGILMHYRDDDEREPSERFAAQIGDDEAVEYDEVYAMICDVALEVHRRANLDPILELALATATDAEVQSIRDKAEIERLRDVIAQAYSSRSWDIGIVKSALVAGLRGYENTGWAARSKEQAFASHAHAHEWEYTERTQHCKCGASRMLDSDAQAAREIARFSE